MRRFSKTFLAAAGLTAAIFAITACPGGGVPSVPNKPNMPGQSASSVDPNTCGNYAATDAGRKLKAFFEATVQLDKAVHDSENYLLDTCKMMGTELGMTALEGDTKTVCTNVINQLKDNLKVGIKAEAKLDIQYKPAVCEVNVEAAADFAAKCEGKATADVAVKCEGTCSGTCNGTCDGTCQGQAGTAGSGGQCNGQCDGTCSGTCSAGCDGHADVDASAECKAKAEVSANVEAKCTEPEVTVNYDAGIVVDKTKLDAAVAAIKKGLPRILMIQKKMAGPVMAAFTTWSKTAQDLAAASGKLASSFGDQAMCITGQLAAAAKMVAGIQVSINVQVEVSASASASAGAGA